jgi:hypothetical protein
VRVLLYLGALTSGILDGLTDAECSTTAALASPRERQLLLRRLWCGRSHAKREEAVHRKARLFKQAMEDRLDHMLSRASVRSVEGASRPSHAQA